MKISIIIPAYNEEKTIKEIIDKIIQLNFGNNIEKEIIIINDYSKDDTLKVLQTILIISWRLCCYSRCRS